MEISTSFQITELAKAPLDERSVLVMDPAKLTATMMAKRARYGIVCAPNGQGNAQEKLTLEREIQLLRKRATRLKADDDLPTMDAVRTRQRQIGLEFAALDKKGNKKDWYVRQGFQIELKILEARAVRLHTSGPTIKTLEPKRWRAVNRFAAQALPPSQWQQISPRLVENPDASLDESTEFRWYMSTLSEARRAEIHALSSQMNPIGDQVRNVVCLPAKLEGNNIRKTLTAYLGQIERDGTPYDYKKTRFVVFDNCVEGQAFDNTSEEVTKFLREARRQYPDLQVDFIRAVFSPRTARIGNIRNIITAAIIESSIQQRKKPAGDLIFISNDADIPYDPADKIKGVPAHYLAKMTNEFDTHPHMDALAGKIDFPEKYMSQVPLSLAARRLWQYMELYKWKRVYKQPYLVGRNSALRLKMVAAVGNYDSTNVAGEDIEIGNKVKWVRSWDKKSGTFNNAKIIHPADEANNTIRYVHSIGIESDPRRDLIRIIGNERIRTQYAKFETQIAVRGKGGKALVEQAVAMGHGKFDRDRFEREAAQFYWTERGETNSPAGVAFALRMMGVKWELRNGKFKLTDTSVLEKNIQEHNFRYLYQPHLEKFIGVPIRSVDVMRDGVNNKVFSVITADGRHLIIRLSSQQDKKPYVIEKLVIDRIRQRGVPTSKVVALESDRKVIKGHTISVVERLPGKPWKRSATQEFVPEIILAEAGQYLRRIHEAPVPNGYGFLDENGNGKEASWQDFVMKVFNTNRFRKLIQQGVVNEGYINAATTFAQARQGLLAGIKPQQLHGDFSIKNLLVNNNHVTGVIDLESAKSGDPLWDIAHMTIEDRESMSTVGLNALLRGYGIPNLLTNANARDRFNLYRMSDILYQIEYYGWKGHAEEQIRSLNGELQKILTEMRIVIPATTLEMKGSSTSEIYPIDIIRIKANLKKGYERAVQFFHDFYRKGLVKKDQEYMTAGAKYQEIQVPLTAALRKGDRSSKDTLFNILKQDELIAKSGFSETELRRQIDRIVEIYQKEPRQFDTIDQSNPAFRFILYLRNRGTLDRYEREYANLPREVDFRKIVIALARDKAARGENISILDEGGTLDVALQQLTGFLHAHVPGVKVRLASIAADNYAAEYADCHKFPVDHRMADVHELNQVFADEKRSLVISQAAYKFFGDPIGAMVQSVNSLEKGGWAFLGDWREGVAYDTFKMFRGENGNALDPENVFEYLNSLNLGYKFYTGMHISKRNLVEQSVITVAVHKETDKDLELPMYYGVRQKGAREPADVSSLVYIIPTTASGNQRFSSYQKVT